MWFVCNKAVETKKTTTNQNVKGKSALHKPKSSSDTYLSPLNPDLLQTDKGLLQHTEMKKRYSKSELVVHVAAVRCPACDFGAA